MTNKKITPEATGATLTSNTDNSAQKPALFQALKADITASGYSTLVEYSNAENSEPDTFPLHCLPPQWKELARQSADLAQMPVQLPAMTMLATASAAIGKSYIATGGSNLGDNRANLYIIACAKSSTGKDVAARLADPFFEYERELLDQHAQSEYAEDTPKPVLSVSNATSEALADRMQNPSETLFSFSAEAGDLIRVAAGIYKNGKGEFAFYNGAWSGTHTQFSRVSREDVTLSSPCLALCWSVQPDYFGELCRSPEAMHSGFIPRCLSFDAATTYALDDGIDRAIEKHLSSSWKIIIRRILDKRRDAETDEPERVPCTPAAREIFKDFHNKHQERRNRENDIADLLGKARENATRIALVLAVMDNREEIGTGEAYAGCAIVDWCLQSTIGMMKEARFDALEREADKLDQKLTSKDYNGQATLRDLAGRNGFEKPKVRQLAERFPERFELETIHGTGRPSEVVRTK
jgi:hypothetical protein